MVPYADLDFDMINTSTQLSTKCLMDLKMATVKQILIRQIV